MERGKKFISLILAVAMVMSIGVIYSFAVGDSSERVNTVSASTVATRGTYNDCLWKGEATMGNPSGRNITLEGDTYAYHNVDKIGFVLYLERKDPDTLIITTEGTFRGSKLNDDFYYKAFAKTVTEEGYYRIFGLFYTEHSLHQDESDSVTTAWMWID